MALTQISTAGVKDDAVTSGKIPANAVGSSEIADEAVTLAKLPHGTSSNDGKFLRANNGADPTFESVPSPAITGISNATNNRVLTSEGGTTVNSESNLIFDGSNLGIGTNNPSGESINGSQNLVIMDTSSDGGMNIKTGTSANAQIHFSDTSGNGQGRLVYDHSNDSMKFFTSGSERVRINSDGRVGIGKTASSTFDIETANNANGFNLNCIGTAANYMFNVRDDNVSKFFIKNDGKVGIGTDSPDQSLHVHKGSAGSIDSTANSVLTLENSSDAILQFLSPSSNVNQIRFGDPSDNGAGYIDYNHGNNVLSFGTAGPERMRLSSSGELIIGGTSLGAAGSFSMESSGHVRSVLASGTTGDTLFGAISGVSNGFQVNISGTNVQRYSFHNGSTVTARIDSDGLKFMNDTSANNALDDFEKGAWTPRIGPNGNNSIYESGVGTYTKVGDKVTIYYAFINKNPNSFGSSIARIWNLPYNITHAGNVNSGHDYGTCDMMHNITFNHNGKTIFYTNNNASELTGLESRSGNSWQNWTLNNFANSFYLHGHLTYFTDNY